MMKHLSFLMVLLLIVLVACSGTLEVGIECTPTPDHSIVATVSALMAENNRLATQVAMQVTPVPPSPNLGRVAYVQGGDIWFKTLPDGKPQRATTDGRNQEPRWSPTGEWLAFRRDKQVTVEQEITSDIPKPRGARTEWVSVLQKQVWLIEANGTGAHPLNRGMSVDAFAWSPTADQLAYTAAAEGLDRINADGTDLITLVRSAPGPNSPGQLGRFAWSPDGRWIAYEWRVQPTDQSPAYQSLWKVSADGKEREELYPGNLPKKGEIVLAGWSPLGKSVFFWQSEAPTTSATDGAAFYAVSVEKGRSKGSVPVRLDTEVVLPYADFVAPAPLDTSWGGRDAVALVAGGGRSTWQNKRVELAGQTITPKHLASISPAWSPQGTYLAFAAMPDSVNQGTSEPVQPELIQRRIWVTNVVDEPRPQRLTESPGYRDERPLWSADGNYILFVRIDAKGRASLWIVPVDRGSPRQVVDELTPALEPVGFYGHVDWDVLFDWWRGLTT